jgi:hypothetical protein
MKKIEWARLSTSEEIDKLKEWFALNNSKEGFEWIVKNKDKVLKDHETFLNDYYLRKKEKAKKRHEDYIEITIKKNKEVFTVYNKLKSGEQIKCICGGNLKIISYNTKYFIGCDNYKNQVLHSKYNYKNDVDDFNLESFNESFEYPKHYLSSIIKEYNYPKFVKPSNLYEFLQINDIQLAAEINDEFFYRLSFASKKSKDRERIIKPVLESIFDKVWYQQHITVKYEHENKKIKIPDFICKRNDMLYIFEQKKSPENCMDDQLNEYVDVVKFITKNNNIKGFFIVEEETNNDFFKTLINYYTINTLQNEFN